MPPNTQEGRDDWILEEFTEDEYVTWNVLMLSAFTVHEMYLLGLMFREAGL